jgi:hypothetical protein
MIVTKVITGADHPEIILAVIPVENQDISQETADKKMDEITIAITVIIIVITTTIWEMWIATIADEKDMFQGTVKHLWPIIIEPTMVLKIPVV